MVYSAVSVPSSDDDGASTSSVLSGSHGGSPRPDQEPGSSLSIVLVVLWPEGIASTHFFHAIFYYCSQRFSSMMSSTRGRLAGRRIVVERRTQRGLGRSLLSRTPLVPASEVPEDLVEEVCFFLWVIGVDEADEADILSCQAMAVLQGKSREVVVRELQRTVCGVIAIVT